MHESHRSGEKSTAGTDSSRARRRARSRGPYSDEEHAAWCLSGYLMDLLLERGELRVGVVCDTGEPMHGCAGPMASLAWVILHAVRSTVDDRGAGLEGSELTVRGAAVATGSGTEVTRWLTVEETYLARRVPALTIGGPTRLVPALDEAVAAAQLTEFGAARLLVVITDGRAAIGDLAEAAVLLGSLRELGCGVLWLCPATAVCVGSTLPGLTLLIDPDDHLVTGVLGEGMREAIVACDPGDAADGDTADGGAGDTVAGGASGDGSGGGAAGGSVAAHGPVEA